MPALDSHGRRFRPAANRAWLSRPKKLHAVLGAEGIYSEHQKQNRGGSIAEQYVISFSQLVRVPSNQGPGRKIDPPASSRSEQSLELPFFIRRKLALGAANDPAEHEADRVADSVMASKSESVSTHAGGMSSDGPHEVLGGSGRSLDDGVRDFMSPRFGRDFSRVRVHTDSDAAESADVLDAAAYSVGNDVIFAPGQYRPDSEPGRRLIAHELAHVAQTDSSGSQGDQGHLVRRQTSKGPMADAVPHPQPNPMDSPTFKAGVRLAEFLEAPKRAIAEKIAREFLASPKKPKPSGEPWQPTFSAVTTYAGGLGGGSHFQTPYTVEPWSQDEVVAALLPVIKLLGV